MLFIIQDVQNNFKRVRCSNLTETKEQVGLQMPRARQKVSPAATHGSCSLNGVGCQQFYSASFTVSISNQGELAQSLSHCFHSITNTCLLVVLALLTPEFMEGSNKIQVIHSIKTGKVQVIKGGQKQ